MYEVYIRPPQPTDSTTRTVEHVGYCELLKLCFVSCCCFVGFRVMFWMGLSGFVVGFVVGGGAVCGAVRVGFDIWFGFVFVA